MKQAILPLVRNLFAFASFASHSHVFRFSELTNASLALASWCYVYELIPDISFSECQANLDAAREGLKTVCASIVSKGLISRPSNSAQPGYIQLANVSFMAVIVPEKLVTRGLLLWGLRLLLG
jgi:hypothetical protein